MVVLEDKIKNIALAASNLGDNIITPDNENDASDKKKTEDSNDNTSNDFAFFAGGFFLFFHFFTFYYGRIFSGFKFTALLVKIQGLDWFEKICGSGERNRGFDLWIN